MATKADFTEEEWKAMQEGITGAGMLVAISDPGFWDTFKEASALAKHVNEAHTKSDSALVRELAQGHDKPFGATASAAEAEQATVDALHAAVAALEAKSPEDLPAYKQVVLDVAQSVAEAAKGVSAKRERRARHDPRRTRDAVAKPWRRRSRSPGDESARGCARPRRRRGGSRHGRGEEVRVGDVGRRDGERRRETADGPVGAALRERPRRERGRLVRPRLHHRQRLVLLREGGHLPSADRAVARGRLLRLRRRRRTPARSRSRSARRADVSGNRARPRTPPRRTSARTAPTRPRPGRASRRGRARRAARGPS